MFFNLSCSEFFSIRILFKRISRLKEDKRGLSELPNDETLTFNDKLSKSNDTTIHVKNIQKFLIDSQKYLYRILAHIITQFFTKRVLPNPKTKKYSTDTTVYKAAQIWSMLPAKYKNLSSLDLKSEMKNGYGSKCPCDICRNFCHC